MLAKYYLDKFDSRNLFDPFYAFSDFTWPQTASFARKKINYDVVSDDASLTLIIDLPGVKKEDLHVESIGQTISIKAKRGEEDCTAAYKISKDYDPAQVDALLENGVLTLKFNRAKSADTRSITVK